MRAIRTAALAALLSTTLGAATAARAQTDDGLYEPVIDRMEGDVAERIDALELAYAIQAELTPATMTAPATLAGDVEIDYANTTGEELDAFYLRLYPNNPQYDEGGMALSAVTATTPGPPGGDPVETALDEAGVAAALDVDDTLLTIELAEPLPAGERLTVRAAFETTVPTDLSRSYGMFQYDSATEVYALAHWFPALPGFDPEAGWEIGALSQNGDPVFSTAGTFDLTLTAPSDLVIATSGSVLETEEGADATTYRIAAPGRDLVMAASTEFEVLEQVVGGTTVRSFALPGSEEGNAAALDFAAGALEVMNELIGPYPFEELDLIQVGLGGGAGGVEFPGIVYVGADYYAEPESFSGIPDFLEFVTAHEVLHQWWYGVVGNAQYRHAFLDEALTNYLTTVYFEERYGVEAGEAQRALQLELTYLAYLFEGGDAVVDQPTDDFDSGAYGAIVYGKGALGFHAVREEIGDEAFFGALGAYYEANALGVAIPDDLLSAFEDASGEQLDELWRHWFLAAEGEQDYSLDDLLELITDLELDI